MKVSSWIAGAAIALPVCVGLGVSVGVSVAAAPDRSPVAAASSPSSRTSAEPTGGLTPAPYEREVATIVAEMLQRYHYDKHPIDDEMSERWLDNYLDALDYGRMVFLQSDIDEFETHRDTLDDDLLANPPRLDVAMAIHERYRQRMRERAQFALGLLGKPLDLANDEVFLVDRHDQDLPWPADAAAANELWRQRTEEEVISDLVGGRDTEPEIRDRLHKRYDRLLKGLEDTESTDVLEVWLGSLTRAYDPHSTWFKPSSNDDFDIEITNSVEGIGASLSADGDYTTVADVIAGGPAFRDERLRKEDRILAVAQGGEDPVDVVGMRLDKVVKLIRGPKGSKVVLSIEHADNTREDLELVRDQVVLEDSAAEASVEHVGSHTLGVVDLPSFYVAPDNKKNGRRASEDIKRALGQLEQQGVEGVILDLRGNGGGSLIEAIDVAGLFLPAGPVVQVRDRDGKIEALHDSDPNVAWGGPLIVLTDATSASASEIVAGALQDYGRAVVVGDASTHGKGTVQQVAQLTQQLSGRYDDDVGGALKLTVQKFYRVSGGSTQTKGVEADVVLPSRWDGIDVHESDLDYHLPWDRIPPAPHIRTGDPSTVLAELRTRSEARRSTSEDFAKLGRIVAEQQALNDEKQVSLVLDARIAEYQDRKARTGLEDDAPDDDEKLTADQRKAKARKADFVLDEALAVLSDY
ncbi:MAG: carboxy terminal-processing peptidase, partial [Myxococcota bacterium]